MATIDIREEEKIEAILDKVLETAKKLKTDRTGGEILTIKAAEETHLHRVRDYLKSKSPKKWDYQIRYEKRVPWTLYIKKRFKPPAT